LSAAKAFTKRHREFQRSRNIVDKLLALRPLLAPRLVNAVASPLLGRGAAGGAERSRPAR
jgi:hypothetical protein